MLFSEAIQVGEYAPCTDDYIMHKHVLQATIINIIFAWAHYELLSIIDNLKIASIKYNLVYFSSRFPFFSWLVFFCRAMQWPGHGTFFRAEGGGRLVKYIFSLSLYYPGLFILFHSIFFHNSFTKWASSKSCLDHQ